MKFICIDRKFVLLIILFVVIILIFSTLKQKDSTVFVSFLSKLNPSYYYSYVEDNFGPEATLSRLLKKGNKSYIKTEKRELLHETIIDKSENKINREIHNRLFCWIPSSEQRKTKLKSINETWVRRCNHHLFFVNNMSKYPPS